MSKQINQKIKDLVQVNSDDLKKQIDDLKQKSKDLTTQLKDLNSIRYTGKRTSINRDNVNYIAVIRLMKL